ncbi:MAG: alanine--glyoxylate aminotransferase family protein [Candidatus Margulisbacteria bacterium]|nr:alanine--glyoxylate aminotransferase family protein [Candidatus Margulisiibacteriota bacterium]MBU1022074.1 alanine--glyoxylate aminotransferase family protein [Candidatus Margulisiibacteriota bacterium]MBU1729669.1 alanine--glyoxylate aminotransferase family protein [Candidatus Margulisiibacteriota bacterium]MBU1767990.1 alanine--glyoxylate aminotransferase family protein [Candidatus Omnitrophota bacterium]MBU1954989.1 alanine--glyoxylate aminotransferase family protein [Candidatus Margulis
MTEKKPLKQFLMIPGPTPIPVRILAAMNREMIGHRGPVFSRILGEVLDGLKWCYQTKNDVMIFPCSGTGVMEAAVVNTLSAGDKVIVCNTGNFGERFIKILKAYGVVVDEVKAPALGKTINIAELETKLAADKNKEIKAVFMQQNETSTTVLNDVKKIAEVVRKHGALIIVDAISGLLTSPLPVDEWGLDVVLSGSQKAFMVPPGIAAISMSERAWKACETSKLPKYYWDCKQQKKFADKGQTFTTPPESIIFGMHESIKMLKEEGLENIFERHALVTKAVRAGVRAAGCQLLADDACASHAVTAIIPPDGIDGETVRSEMRKFGVEVAPGQGELKGKIFRIGHLGYVDKLELVATIGALELLFTQLGAKGIEIGRGPKAMLEMFS